MTDTLVAKWATQRLNPESNPVTTYGLWNPTQDGQRNAREAALSLTIADAATVQALREKMAAGKVEAQQMLASSNVCERSIGEFHRAFYAELETSLNKAAAV